ncbi:MAG: flagellin [Ectothiorhodospiraceae bacterium]|nr:flagellin [Ectothiorhodospiraceae bacterium]
MSQVINTNIASLNAQRNLTRSQGDLQTSLQRLSSGLRINSAKDDAAGLAISERFSAQIRGQQQAQRNANDGISLAQTAEGALTEIGNLMQRARELAVQAANDSNSASDRAALNEEVQQAISEVARIANATQFNNQSVLDGSLSNLLFQVGANQGQVIGVDGVDARASQLGAQIAESAFVSPDQLGNIEGFADITIEIDGQTISIQETLDGNLGDAAAQLDEIDNFDDLARAINQAIRLAESGNAFDGAGDAIDADDLSGADIAALGLSAAVSVDNEGGRGLTIRGASGSEFTVAGGETDGVVDDAGDPDEVTLFSAAGDPGDIGNGEATARNLADDVNVLTRQSATLTIGIIDGALDQVNGLRADFGAVQNRFESTVSNLGISAENLSASRSRILDADFAAETAALTRAQILQQAGTSVLSQANAVPQNVLALLG